MGYRLEEGLVMSDREDPPTDLFDVICRLDDLADWLDEDYRDEASRLRDISRELKGFIGISLVPEGRG